MAPITPLSDEATTTDPAGSPPGGLGRWGAAMAAHARWVFGVWLLVLLVLGAAAPSV